MKIRTFSVCKFCGKECKNLNALRQHEIRCKENPDRIEVKSNFIQYNKDLQSGKRVSWCKGLTKETDLRIKSRRDTQVKNYQSGNFSIWSQGLTKETDERIKNLSNKIRKTVTDKIIDDSWHNCRSKKIKYDGFSFDSIWEVYFYKYVKLLGYNIIRCKEVFSYIYNNVEHFYIPDFYIEDLDLYVEIKSYPTERDIEKWNQFPKNLNIYFGHNLRNLGIEEMQSYKENENRIVKYENSVPVRFRDRKI